MMTEEEWSRQIAKAVREYLQQHTRDLLEKVDDLLATRQRKYGQRADGEEPQFSANYIDVEYRRMRNAIKGLTKGERT